MTTVEGTFCHADGITGYGDPEYGVVLVGIAPGKDEVKTGRPFTGRSGRLLDATLKAVGWPREQCFATNLICWNKDDPTPEEIDVCWPRLQTELHSLQPRLVVALGALATERLTGYKLGAARGAILHDCGPWPILSTYHPAAVLRVPELATDLINDLKKVRRYMNGELGRVVVRPPTIVRSVQQAQMVFNLIEGKKVALDVETERDDEDTFDYITCVAIATEDRRSWVFPAEVLKSPLLRWPKRCKWGFHNGPFDTQKVRREFGIWLPIDWDTMLKSNCCDERPGHHGLKGRSREFNGAGFYESEVKGKLAKPPPIGEGKGQFATLEAWKKKLYFYNACDTIHTIVLDERLPTDDFAADCYYNLLLPGANAFKEIQYEGILVDEVKLDALVAKWTPKVDAMRTELQTWAREAGFINPPKRKRDLEGEPLNLASHVQLGKLLYGIFGLPGGPSTAKAILNEIDHPFIERLQEFRQYDHVVRAYLLGIKDDIKADGHVHPNFLLHGTVTGRLSCTDPPIQTIPKAYTVGDELALARSIFVARPGFVLVEADYAQIEIWVAAALSQDSAMFEDLANNYHSRVAREVLGNTDPDDSVEFQADRQRAKKVTFGIMYGIGAKKLASKTYGIGCTNFQSAQFIQRWYKRNATFGNWQQSILKQARTTGEIVTPFGRKRRFPYMVDQGMDRQAINFPIQSVASDHSLVSLIELHNALKPLGARVLLAVHDSLLFEVPDNERSKVECREMIRRVMETPKLPGFPSMKVDMKEGYTWFNMH